MANGLNIRETASALSPFITKLILQKKERDRKEKQRIEDLKKKEKADADKVRQEFLIKNFDKLPEQTQNSVLSEFSIKTPGTEPELQALDQANLLPQERDILLKELRRQADDRALQERLKGFGLTSSGIADLASQGVIPGIAQTPESLAKTENLKQKTETEKTIQSLNNARAKAQKQLAEVRRKIVKGTGSQKRQALDNLQKSLLRQVQLLDKIFLNDPKSVGTIEEYNQERNDIINQLRGVRQQLKEIGGVKTQKTTGEITPEQASKMTTEEILKNLK